VSVPARQLQVAYGRERGRSTQRACTLFSVAQSALSSQGRKAVNNAPVATRMKELSAAPQFRCCNWGTSVRLDG